MASAFMLNAYIVMVKDSKSFYRALIARDRRFDGLFFVGVTSTGIYCRPICPVKAPKQANCRFFNNASAAEQAGFRPCLRCRPELAPGNAPVDHSQRIAHLIVQRIENGNADEKTDLNSIAREFELSGRQIRRVIRKEIGVPPIQLILTRRLLLAKQLLTETQLPIIDIAFASGFSSLRRFNDAFSSRYGIPPSRIRKNSTTQNQAADAADVSTIQLAYRPPYDWAGVLDFLRTRQMQGIEHVTDDAYLRTIHIGAHKGWIKVTQSAAKHAFTLEFPNLLSPILPTLINRVRDLFDLNARPEIISRHLAKDPALRPIIKSNRGLRLPGAFHGFELGLRAILGQQITVKAATTLAGRVATAFGEPIATPFPELNRLSPSPERLARATVSELARLGIISARAKTIIALAQAQISGKLSLDSGTHHDPEIVIQRLTELPGIGDWTAHYIAMRALRWPDAFPIGDIAVRNKLGRVTAKQAEALSQSWRPWRSYAVLQIWRCASLNFSPPDVITESI